MIEVFVPLGLGLYFALILWCRNQGNRVLPRHVWIMLVFKRAVRVVLSFDARPALEAFAKAARAVEKFNGVFSEHSRGLAIDVKTQEYAAGGVIKVETLNADEMFGNRRWVRDKNGRLVERYGTPQEGDEDVMRSIQ